MKLLEKFRFKTPQERNLFIIHNLLVALGSAMLAFGTVVFIQQLSIVTGGISGIAIIVQSFFEVQIYDYVIVGLTVVTWVIGLIFLGKKFVIRTTFASIIYSVTILIFARVPFFSMLATQMTGDGDAGNILVCAIFYGVFSGAGVALTFLGGGSTGGVDVLIYLISKKTHWKESIISFGIDGLIILASLFLIKDNVISSCCGLIGAFVAALMIEYVYVGNQNSYQADIISPKWEEISRFAQDEMGRGATIIPAKGGYKGEERIILRVVFEKRQFNKLKKFIAKVDPKAFVTYTATLAVYGEGFQRHK